MAGPRYRVLVYETDGTDTFGVGDLVAEFPYVKNIGWAKYLSDVGESYFTVMQDDPKLALIDRTRIGDLHVKILRNNHTVWRGLMGEHDARRDDVVFYNYGYESAMFWLTTAWGSHWENALIGDDIVTDLWHRAKNLTYSQLGFVATGTINNPVTTSGGTTAITLPRYKTYYKRILFALRELVDISTSNTTNTVFWEFAYDDDPADNAVTFNFYKNRSDDTDTIWRYDQQIENFGDKYAPLLTRNIINAVASGPRNQVFKSAQARNSGDRGYENFGRHTEPIYIQWVRDQTGLDNVAKQRLHTALRSDTDLTLRMKPSAIVPIDATTDYKLGDTVRVKIDKGITQINKRMFLDGMQVISIRGVERCFPMLSDRNPS